MHIYCSMKHKLIPSIISRHTHATTFNPARVAHASARCRICRFGLINVNANRRSDGRTAGWLACVAECHGECRLCWRACQRRERASNANTFTRPHRSLEENERVAAATNSNSNGPRPTTWHAARMQQHAAVVAAATAAAVVVVVQRPKVQNHLTLHRELEYRRRWRRRRHALSRFKLAH